MRYFLVFCLLIGSAFLVKAQTYTTVQSGNFSSSTTWSLGSIPPTATPCNCQIIISPGNTLTLNSNMTITNANFVLNGTNSVLTFSNNVDIIMSGANSSINVKSGARIVKGNNNNNISLGSETIYDGQTTMVNSSTGGTVNGPASASAARASGPQFINSVLPVKLSEFKVAESNGQVLLNWTTDQEKNSEYFQIERSSDGKGFSSIGVVAASGNSDVQLKYSFTDNLPLVGANYYRLKIVDLDAKFEFSPVKSINISLAGSTLAVTPNPASSLLNIKVNQQLTKDYQLKLINRTGQVLYSRRHSANAGKISIPISSYPEGSYFIELTDATGTRTTKNILIIRSR